jgi:hypothetical protein
MGADDVCATMYTVKFIETVCKLQLTYGLEFLRF